MHVALKHIKVRNFSKILNRAVVITITRIQLVNNAKSVDNI